jgi:hypothetical protein
MPVLVDPAWAYPELVIALDDYLNRDLSAQIPTFIAMTEAKLNRLLDDPEMEVRATMTSSAQYTTLPSDFKRIIGVTTGGSSLQQISGSRMTALDQTITGSPRQYAIVDGAITFAPISSLETISILYSRRIPALTEAAPTNWLIETSPDVYLYGALMQAHIFGWNDERVPGFKALFDEAIDELRQDASNRRWGSSPIAPRLGRT